MIALFYNIFGQCMGTASLGLFPVGLPVETLKTLLPSSILAIWPAHPNLLDNHSDYIRWTVQIIKFLIVGLFHCLFSSVLVLNIRLRILFSNTLSLDSSLNVRDHVSQPYSTTGIGVFTSYNTLVPIVLANSLSPGSLLSWY